MDGWMDRRTNLRAISRAETATGYLSSLLPSSPLPSAPVVALNERRDARAWRCSQLFSRRCISAVQHQFLVRVGCLSVA